MQEHWPAVISRGYRILMYPGQVLFYAGHIPHGLYILHSGLVEFSPTTHGCMKESILHAPHAEALCLDHVVGAEPYCSTCTASRPCVLTIVPRAYLQHLFSLGIDPQEKRPIAG